MKAIGMVTNQSARATIIAAIQRANKQDNAGTLQYSPIEFIVESATRSGVEYVVTIEEGFPARCTCLASSLNHVCWHIAKCLMLQGISEPLLVLHLGTNYGSKTGGYEALWAPTPSTALITPSPNPSQTPAAGVEAQETTHHPEPSTRVHERLRQLLEVILNHDDQNPGSSDLSQLEHSLRIQREAQLRWTAVENASSVLLPNPDAPPGMSLKRLLPAGEKRKRGARNPASTSRTHPLPASMCGTQLAQGEGLPFMPKKVERKKLRTVAAEVDRDALKAAEKAGRTTGRPTPVSSASDHVFPHAQRPALCPMSEPTDRFPTCTTFPHIPCAYVPSPSEDPRTLQLLLQFVQNGAASAVPPHQ